MHVLSSNLDYPQVLHIWLVPILRFNPLLVLHGTYTKSLNSISFAFATLLLALSLLCLLT